MTSKDGYGGELDECSSVGGEGWILPMACISCFGVAGRGECNTKFKPYKNSQSRSESLEHYNCFLNEFKLFILTF